MTRRQPISTLFFFNDTATTEIYPLSLHDALPICHHDGRQRRVQVAAKGGFRLEGLAPEVVEDRAPAGGQRRGRDKDQRRDRHPDRKSTRLNSSHLVISYAVFCLKKKKVKYHMPPY